MLEIFFFTQLLFFILINFTLGIASITLAHIDFCLSFVAISVKTRMFGMDDSIISAARDLGASPFKAFYLILIPTILPVSTATMVQRS